MLFRSIAYFVEVELEFGVALQLFEERLFVFARKKNGFSGYIAYYRGFFYFDGDYEKREPAAALYDAESFDSERENAVSDGIAASFGDAGVLEKKAANLFWGLFGEDNAERFVAQGDADIGSELKVKHQIFQVA